MRLIQMSEEEFALWAPRSRAAYAADKMRANGYSKEEAAEIARSDFQRILPDGLSTKDNFLFTAKDANESTLGFIWFCIRGPQGNRRAFICDVVIEEPFRGKGQGKAMMALVEEEIRKQGLNRIELHVFGFNEIAISLYKKMGYAITDLNMEKKLTES